MGVLSNQVLIDTGVRNETKTNYTTSNYYLPYQGVVVMQNGFIAGCCFVKCLYHVSRSVKTLLFT
jgi:hypothetical protein